MKNRSDFDSYTAAEAAAILHVSVPTLKKMVDDGRLKSFRTSGGHVRVAVESIKALRDTRSVHDVSPVLQNRRDQIEETVLETQALRAKRDLAKLQQEQQEETDRHEALAEAHRQEAAQRRADQKLERQKLELEERRESARDKQRRNEETRRRQTERAVVDFRSRWHQQASVLLLGWEYGWLSHKQRQEISDGLDAEIKKRDPSEESNMTAILRRSLSALLEPLEVEHHAKEMREEVIQGALRGLPWQAKEADQVKARGAIQKAIERFDNFASKSALRVAADEAVRPICEALQRRALSDTVLSWAVRQLPSGYSDVDEARVRRECSALLADLPSNILESEAKAALAGTIADMRTAVERRLAADHRGVRKTTLIQEATSSVTSYLLHLTAQNQITAEQFFDGNLSAQLTAAVKNGLETALSGDETSEMVKEKTHEIIDGQLARRAAPKTKKLRRADRSDQW